MWTVGLLMALTTPGASSICGEEICPSRSQAAFALVTTSLRRLSVACLFRQIMQRRIMLPWDVWW